MRGLLVLGLLLLAGCQNVIGPFRPRSPQRVDDPNISIQDQEFRARDRLALPQENEALAPYSGAARPGMFADR